MRILVTGGAGFIGSHLCAALVAEGHAVVAVDNLLTGRESNIEHLRAHPAFCLSIHDVSLPLEAPADAIFHLASPASPIGYRKYSLETMAVNARGTTNLLELAHRQGARFLMASTSEAYGDPLVHPQREDYWGNVNPVGPRACYDESKRFAEAVTMEYVRKHGVDARVVRIFNTYGPHSDPNDGRLVPNFITQALRNEPITVYGDGEQTRSLCYVDDMVRGLMAALFTEGTRGEVINLGNPDERSVNDFAVLIRELAGSNAPMVYRPLPLDDPLRRCPDIEKARRLLSWEPRMELRNGLHQTLDWFRSRLDIPSEVTD